MAPEEVCVSGGGGAGRFGRIRVCGTAAGTINAMSRGRERKTEEEKRVSEV